MEYLKIVSHGRRFKIVAFGSLVGIGPKALAAIKATPGTKTENLSLEDAQCTKAELEELMAQNVAHIKKNKK